MINDSLIKLHINDYARLIGDWRRNHGFYTPENIDTEKNRDMMLGKLMLIDTEIAEAAEAVRHNNFDNFKEELADAFIRLMDITNSCNIDIEIEIVKKMSINKQRPIKHGKLCSL